MEFAIAYPARPDAWKDLVIAEDHGFSHAWFYDSQMIYSDVYVCLALAAEHTKRIKLGTGVAIPSNRIEPVTAHSIATINLLAPGRAMLGIGTGFTGRNTMGLPPVQLERMREYIEMCRKLLRGEEVMYREGKRERAIRFLHPNTVTSISRIRFRSNRGQRSQGARTRGRDRRRMDYRALRSRALPQRIQAHRRGRGARRTQA